MCSEFNVSAHIYGYGVFGYNLFNNKLWSINGRIYCVSEFGEDRQSTWGCILHIKCCELMVYKV